MSRSSRSSSRARADSVTPSGTSGSGAAIATSGSQSNSRRTFSTACSRRSRISASSISSRPARSRSSTSCCSAAARSARKPVELHARGARGLRLLAPAAAQPLGEPLGLVRPFREALGERVDGRLLRFELGAAGAGAGFLVGTGGEPGLELGESRRADRCAALRSRRGGSRAAGAARPPSATACSTSARLAARCSTAAASARARLVECRFRDQHPRERDVARFGILLGHGRQRLDARREVRTPFLQRRGLHVDRAPAARPPAASAPRARGGGPGRARSRASSARRAAASCWRASSDRVARPLPRASSASSACSTASASAAGVTADTPGGPARHGLGPPNRSPSRVTAITSARERDVERCAPSAVDEHERRQHAREEPVERRRVTIARTTRAAARPAARRAAPVRRRALAEYEHQRRRVGRLEPARPRRVRRCRRRPRPRCSASPSAAATATSAPDSISRWSASRPSMPSSGDLGARR